MACRSSHDARRRVSENGPPCAWFGLASYLRDATPAALKNGALTPHARGGRACRSYRGAPQLRGRRGHYSATRHRNQCGKRECAFRVDSAAGKEMAQPMACRSSHGARRRVSENGPPCAWFGLASYLRDATPAALKNGALTPHARGGRACGAIGVRPSSRAEDRIIGDQHVPTKTGEG